MFYRIFLFLTVVLLPLYATPSFEQMKMAIQADPTLLDTPQAQAMMRERGVSADDVRTKLLGRSNSDINSSKVRTGEKNLIDEDFTFEESEKMKKCTECQTLRCEKGDKECKELMQECESISSTCEELLSFDDNKTKAEEEEEEDKITKKANPFLFKDNKELEAELVAKQQRFTENKLNRYSMNFFTNKNEIDPTALPTPDDYIVSSGDVFSVHIYGDRDQEYTLEVKNNGTVDLAYIGPVKIGGMKYLAAKKQLQSKLRSHYKMSSFNINIDKYSAIQVTLVGEVKHPGIYNLSSFATVKDLLIAARGIQSNASVRDIIVKRNSKTVAKIDFYDLLFKGKELSSVLLKHGDIVILQKANKLVSVDGYINNTSIFELNNNENLYDLIEYAGGMKPDAYKLNIKIDRFTQNSKLETFNVDYKNAKSFKMEDGDKVYIYPLDFSVDSSINIYGNIIRPGNYRLNDKTTLNSVFEEVLVNGKKNFFLPQTYFNYGVIKRYSDKLEYETRTFNLSKVLDGSEIVEIKAQDEVFIFSQTDIYSNTYVTTIGDILINPGKLQYFPGMTIQDAINASGVDGIIDDKIRVTTIDTKDRMPKTTFYSLKDQGTIELGAYDEIEVYDYYIKQKLEPISIKGEVLNPTSIFYEDGMTLKDLINVAGGLTRKAYENKIEIVRYYLGDNHNREKEILNIDISNNHIDKVKLQPYDEVTVFKIPRWSERRTVELKGEVRFPGTYTIDNGEKLSSVLRRAGGFTKEAFINGAVFTRESIRKNQVDQYNRALANVKRELAIYGAMPANAKLSAGMTQASAALNEVMQEAQKYQPIGRISVNLSEDIKDLENSPFNLVLQDKDTITIPPKMDTVTVFGEVFNPTSFVHDSTKDSFDYIKLASGFSRAADTERVYVIHADGTSEPINSGIFSFGSIDICKGDTIVVPIYMKEIDQIDLWNNISKILSNFAITAATLSTLGVI